MINLTLRKAIFESIINILAKEDSPHLYLIPITDTPLSPRENIMIFDALLRQEGTLSFIPRDNWIVNWKVTIDGYPKSFIFFTDIMNL